MEKYAFVWGGSWEAVCAELNGMRGRIWGADERYFIANVGISSSAACDTGVGVVANVAIRKRSPYDEPYGDAWYESESYSGLNRPRRHSRATSIP